MQQQHKSKQEQKAQSKNPYLSVATITHQFSIQDLNIIVRSVQNIKITKVEHKDSDHCTGHCVFCHIVKDAVTLFMSHLNRHGIDCNLLNLSKIKQYFQKIYLICIYVDPLLLIICMSYIFINSITSSNINSFLFFFIGAKHLHILFCQSILRISFS